MNKKKMYILSILGLVVLIYLTITFILYYSQRSLLYHPSENNYSGDKLIVPIDKVKILTDDNIELIAWHHKKKGNYKTILFLHGNAGSLENRIHKINHFNDMDVNFLIVAWRGFSGNKGKPSEQGLYIDGNSATRWLKNLGLNEEDIILYGESLGTGIATEIAQNSNFAGLILETPFTSMVDAAKNVYPYIPVGLLLKDRYENYKKIKNINIPILVMHGEADQIVPFRMGKKIYDIAKQPKYSHFTKYDDHMMEYDENLISELKKFIKSLN